MRVSPLRVALVLLLAACDKPAPAPAVEPPKPAPVIAEPEPVAPPAPTVPVQHGEELARRAPTTTQRTLKPRDNGCVVTSDQELSPAELALAIYTQGRAGIVLFRADPPSLLSWTADVDGGWRSGLEVPLEAKALRASASCNGERCQLAWVDDKARLMVSELGQPKLAAPRSIASGLDRRFAPALLEHAGVVHYAYTTSVEEAMHTLYIARTKDKFSTPRDVTPAGHGAAASTFVLGAGQPSLIFIDAHAGISPLLELPFGRDEKPEPVVVRTPVSQPYAPPLLSAVQWVDGRVEVMFSAIGRNAMTAIGRVPLRKAQDASALLPSAGYGVLEFVAARSRQRALFALEVPSAPPPSSPRSLALKLVDGERTDDALTIAAPASKPSLAAGPQAGEYALGYVREGKAHGAQIRCVD